MNHPLISVVMSVFNGEKYLMDSVNSILNQKDVSIELIIINDGSTDNTVSILKNLSEKDDRIKIVNKHKEGLPFALNIGLENAKGKYIARMDADDIAEVNRLKLQVDFLENSKNIDILGTYVTAFGDGRERIWKVPISKDECNVALLFINPLAHPAVMFRKSVVENIGYYDTTFDYDQDYEYWARASFSHSIANLPFSLLKYRIHEKQMGSIFTKSERIDSQQRTQLLLLKKMGVYPNDEEIQLHLILANAYRLEFEVTIDLETLRNVRFYIIKLIAANSNSKRYNENILAERCMIQYSALCLYSANLGIAVYQEFKITTRMICLKKRNILLLASCIFKFSRKEHLFIYNNLNRLKSVVRNIYV
jgi:glycosyltransferase involved in cell wall biosynthesis